MTNTYAFSFGQRVNVPGQDGVQGLVSAPTCTNEMHLPITGITRYPMGRHVYLVRYLLEDGEKTCAWFGDFDLAFANPGPDPEPEPQTERATVIATLADVADKIAATREVHVPAPKRKKPARKSKRK